MNDDDVDVAPVSPAVIQEEKRNDEMEQLFQDAIEMIRVHKRVSGELIRRKLKVGYSRANSVLDMLEDRGVISPIGAGNSREILIDMDQPLPGGDSSQESDELDDADLEMDELADKLPME
jgi:S-DNA-T family DNA segregation ATPase FtsK/SpoIIIE